MRSVCKPRIAQSALVASSRPWVQITDAVVTKLEVQADQVSVWAEFFVQGIGPSPATAVAISPALLVPGLERWPHVETRRLCSEVKTINKVVGYALFPGDVGKLSMNFGRPMRDLIAGRDAHTREMIEGWRSAWGEEEAERLAAGLAQTAN